MISALAIGAVGFNASGSSFGAGVEYLSRDLEAVKANNPAFETCIDGVIQSAAIRVDMKF